MTRAVVADTSDPDLRATGIGASDVARLLGVAPASWGGPMDVYLEKRRMTAPKIETARLRWGKRLEPEIANEYAVQTGRRVSRAAAFLRHAEFEWAFASPDYWSDKGGTPRRVLECKTADAFKSDEFGEPGTDQVPMPYICQVQWQLFVTGKEVADLAALIGFGRFGIFTIERDDALIGHLVAAAQEFWENTQKGIPPDIDGSEGSDRFLRMTYAAKGTERPMDDELAFLARDYAALRERQKVDKAVQDAVGNKMRDLMGNDVLSVGDGVKVTYAEVKGASFVDLDALAADHPAIVEQYRRNRDASRQLRVTVKETL